jgi:hypothetical protein
VGRLPSAALRTRSGRASRHAVALVAAAAAVLLAPRVASAQNCPTAQSGAHGFVVERNERQKTDVYHGDGIVRTVMRVDGKSLLEKTLFEVLFELDRGRRTKYEPRIDLKALFPLQGDSRRARNSFRKTVELRTALRRARREEARGSPYRPVQIFCAADRVGESHSSVPPQLAYTDLYSPDLKLILSPEDKKRDGQAQLIKFARVYPIKI